MLMIINEKKENKKKISATIAEFGSEIHRNNDESGSLNLIRLLRIIKSRNAVRVPL
jgi:hypothetical protein